MRRLRLLTVAGIALACVGGAACSAILGFEHLHEEGGFVLDTGTTTEASAGDAMTQVPDANAAGACNQIGIPDPPPDASASVGPAVLVALKLLDFGVDVDGGRPDVPGFNLDRACSPTLDTSTCTTNVLESVYEHHASDKTPTGVDNAGFSLIQYIGGFSTLLSAANINQGIADGKYGAVLRITNWNGESDDDSVLVELFPAIGLLPRSDADAGFGADDRWVLDKRFQIAPEIASSNVKSDLGWVTGGKLVARFQHATLPILIDRDPKPFDIRISDAILSGTLQVTGGVAALSAGVLAGRWKTSDFLGEVRTIFVKNANGLQNTVLCEPVPTAQVLYAGVKNEICDARDIRGDSMDQAKLPCDALSVAMRIEAYAVSSLGAFDAGPAIAPRCQDAAVPLGNDCTP